MSLLNEIAGQMSNKLPGSAPPGELLEGALSLLHSDSGGLAGLVQKFHDHGLGDAVSSWIGMGKNLPVSAEQVTQVIGVERIQQVALGAGVSHQWASAILAEVLPQLIDKLTPLGALPKERVLQQSLGLLKGKLSRGSMRARRAE